MKTTQPRVSWVTAVITLFAAVGLTGALAQAKKQSGDNQPTAPKAAAPTKDDAPKAPAKNNAPQPAETKPAAPKPAETKPAPAPAPPPAVAAAPAAQPKKSSASATALARQVRDAKQSFVAVDPVTMNPPWAELHRSVRALDAHLKRMSRDNGAAWRAYLQWDKLAAELQKRDVPVDVAVLTDVHDRLTAGYEGLEKKPYRDTAEALTAYLASIATVGNAQLRADYDANLEELADAIEAGGDAPDAEQAATIGRTVGWLSRSGLSPTVVEAVTARYSQPNLLVDLDEAFMADLIGGKVDEQEPVRDVILGTSIHGTGHTLGQVTVDLLESPDYGIVSAYFQGTNQSKTVGYNRSAVIHSRGTTQLEGRTTLYLDGRGVAAGKAVTKANVKNTITGIGSSKGGIVGKITVKVASKQAPQKQPQAQQIAARHAEVRLSKRLDEQTLEIVNRANADYYNKVRYPLERFDAFPRLTSVTSSADRLMMRVLQDRSMRLAAPGAAPGLLGTGAVARLHQSLIDNTAEQALAGRRFDRVRLEDLVVNQLGGELPGSDDDDTPFWIDFTDEQPVSVLFDDGDVSITIRGKRFMNDNTTYKGMAITAKYKSSVTRDGLQLTRDGDLVIQLEEKAPTRVAVLRPILKKKFARLLPTEIQGEGLQLEEGRGTVVVSEAKIDDGWASFGLSRKPTDKTAAKTGTAVGAE